MVVAYVWPSTPTTQLNVLVGPLCFFAASGTGSLVWVHGIMKKENDVEILKDKMHKSAFSPAVCRRSAFQQDNNPKHTLKLVQQSRICGGCSN